MKKDVIHMAYATEITMGTGSKVSVNYQSQEVNVGVTYQLEREDENLLELVESKAAEVESAHRRLWKTIKEVRGKEAQASGADGGEALSDQSPAQREESPPADGSASHQSDAKNGYPQNGASQNGCAQSGQSQSGNHRNGYNANGDSSNGSSQQSSASQDQANADDSPPQGDGITEAQERAVYALSKDLQLEANQIADTLKTRFDKTYLRELTKRQASQLIDGLKRRQRETAGQR
jgi:hypothetical protein